MRRLASVLVGCALAAVVAGPASAAEAYQARATGTSAYAVFSNIDPETFDWENPAPGTYFQTYVDAGASIYSDGETYGPGLCVWYYEFVIDADGQFAGESSADACGDATAFTVDRRLDGASLQASLPVVECVAWSDEDGCLELIELGTLDVDLSWTGTGPIFRSHGASSGGVAGQYQYASHGTAAERSATPSGVIALDGTSLIDGATAVYGGLWTSRDGWVDIYVSGLGKF